MLKIVQFRYDLRISTFCDYMILHVVTKHIVAYQHYRSIIITLNVWLYIAYANCSEQKC